MNQEDEDRIRRDEAAKWLDAIRHHAETCPNMSGECAKKIADERLAMRLADNPKLPVEQWWP